MIFVELTKVWRQSDVDFVACLNRVRRGEMTSGDLDYLNSHCAPPVSAPAATPVGSSPDSPHESFNEEARPGAPRPILLAPFNAVVNERNSKELAEMKKGRCVLQVPRLPLAQLHARALPQRRSHASAPPSAPPAPSPPFGQWIAADWVEVDEDCGGRQQDVEKRLMSAAPGTFFGDCARPHSPRPSPSLVSRRHVDSRPAQLPPRRVSSLCSQVWPRSASSCVRCGTCRQSCSEAGSTNTQAVI